MTPTLPDESAQKMEVLGQFLEELSGAADTEALVRRYAEHFPEWTGDFLEEAVLSRMLTSVKADDSVPDLSELVDFRIVREIAVGGMGIVYEAEQISLQRRVALKVRHGHASPEREAAFEREQRVLAQLHQSHIVPIFYSGRTGIWQYFAMSYIDGATLHQVLRCAWEYVATGRTLPQLPELVMAAKRRFRELDGVTRLAEYAADLTQRSTQFLPQQEKQFPFLAPLAKPIRLPDRYFRSVALLLADAAGAIAHAHAANVIHRDIKPSNIMVDGNGQCWLIDFGLAETLDHPKTQPTAGAAGTPGYIAPEQLQSDAAPCDVRSDVWSLGVTLFEAVTLRQPFLASDPKVTAPPVRCLVPNLPRDLAAICEKALQHDPVKRYPGARELADDLQCWLQDKATIARPVSPWRAIALWSRRNRGWAAAIASACGLLVAAVSILLVRSNHRAERAVLQEQAAEARVNEERQKIRLYQRENWLQDGQRLVTNERNNGWSNNAWELLLQASAVHSDEHIRDLAVSTMRGWDAHQLQLFPFGSSSIAFGPTEQSLVIGGLTDLDGKPVRPATIWSPGLKSFANSVHPGDGPVACDAKGNAVQLIRLNDALVLWNITKAKAIWRYPLPPAKPADADSRTMSLAGDATWFALAEADANGKPRTQIWHVDSESALLQFEFAADAFTFSDDAEFVAIANTTQQRIEIYSLKTQMLVAAVPTSSVPVLSLAFGKNPRRSKTALANFLLATGDAGGTVVIWDLRTQLPVSHCRGLPHQVHALAFNPDGTVLATGGREEVRLWEATTGKPVLRIRPDQGIDYITQLAFSSSGERLAVSSRGVHYPPSTTLWHLDNGRGMEHLVGLTGQVEKLVLSPDGKSLAALAQTWDIAIWDLATGHLKFVREVPTGAFADNAGLAFSPDNQSLVYSVSREHQGMALLLDATNGAELHHWELPPGLQNHIGFTKEGQLWHFQVETESGLALPTSNQPWRENPRVCRIRDLRATCPEAVVAEFRGFPRHIYTAAMTRDGRYTVMEGLGAERGVRIIETATGRVTAAFPSNSTGNGSDLVLDSADQWIVFSDGRIPTASRFSIPNGTRLPGFATPRSAVSSRSGYSCTLSTNCMLYRDMSPQAFANLAPTHTVNSFLFDPSGERLIIGGRDGTVVSCNLDRVVKCLELLESSR